MRGSHNGFVKKLKDKIKHLVPIHCLNHQLALGSNALFTTYPNIEEVYTLVYNVTSLLKTSNKREELFNQIQSIIDVPPYKLILPFKIRCFSMLPVLKRFLEEFPVVIECLRRIYLPIGFKYIQRLSNFKTLAFPHFILDILGL